MDVTVKKIKSECVMYHTKVVLLHIWPFSIFLITYYTLSEACDGCVESALQANTNLNHDGQPHNTLVVFLR